jgi:hypothetical protein
MKKKIRRKIKHQEQAERAKFLERVKKHEFAAGREIVENPPDQVKISEVLLDFAAPLLERFETEVPVKNIIPMAIFAWNLALTRNEDHNKAINEMAKVLSLDEKGIEEMNNLMRWLVDRKRNHFAEHKRRILDYRLSDLGERYGLQVVSVSAPDDRGSGMVREKESV